MRFVVLFFVLSLLGIVLVSTKPKTRKKAMTAIRPYLIPVGIALLATLACIYIAAYGPAVRLL